jgi:hypothetical protein
MLKSISAIVAAAAIAGAITLLSAPAAKVDAVPVAQQIETAMRACNERPWPYLGCVGTQFGNPKIRLVTTEKFSN